ncbi:MAG TPA: ATP-binding protein [Verrucomicrobiae bacterium]|nr:ATP-binding protein [Verrucomicrobiae bacterium]
MTTDVSTARTEDAQQTIRVLQQELRETCHEVLVLNLELEKRVDERTEELRRANEDLEAFSYSISHDLRAPLRAVTQAAEIFSSEYGTRLPEDANQLVAVMVRGANRMREMIEALLNFARLGRQPLTLKPVDLTALAHEVVAELLPGQDARRPEVLVQALPSCKGDPVLLHHVFANLVSNALKFSRQRENPAVEIGACEQDGERVYFIRDNGAGFDMAHAGKMFTVFNRLHGEEQFEGTGVGLSIVRRIVERHGGRIWAHSEIDKGATFYFTLG